MGKSICILEYDIFVCHCCLVIPFPSDLTVRIVMLSGFRLLILQAKFVSNVILDVPVTDVLILWNICVTNGYGYFLRSNHNLVLSLFMTYHGACTTINTTVHPQYLVGFVLLNIYFSV